MKKIPIVLPIDSRSHFLCAVLNALKECPCKEQFYLATFEESIYNDVGCSTDVNDYILDIDWIEVRRTINPTRLGYAANVINALDTICKTEDRFVILEEDVFPGKDFLKLMLFGFEHLNHRMKYLTAWHYNGAEALADEEARIQVKQCKCFNHCGWCSTADIWREFREDFRGPKDNDGIWYLPFGIWLTKKGYRGYFPALGRSRPMLVEHPNWFNGNCGEFSMKSELHGLTPETRSSYNSGIINNVDYRPCFFNWKQMCDRLSSIQNIYARPQPQSTPEQKSDKLKINISVIGYNRPRYLQQVLDSLLSANITEDVYLCLDGNYDKECLKVYEKWPYDKKTINVANRSLGCNRATLQAYRFAIECGDAAILLEDDTILGYDALEFYRWALEYYKDDKNVPSITSYLRCSGQPPAVDFFKVCKQKWHHGWGFATWRDTFEKYFRPAWPLTYPPGWDIALHDMFKKHPDWRQVKPFVSRLQNIGVDNGLNVIDKEWQLNHQHSPFWVDNTIDRTISRGWFDGGEI